MSTLGGFALLSREEDNSSSDAVPTGLFRNITKNVTIYWMFASISVLSWFILGIPRKFRSDPSLIEKPIVIAHLFCSFMTCLACAFNHWRTPKTLGRNQKFLHICMGRFGGLCSAMGALCGEYRTYIAYTESGLEGSNIFLVAVGIWQLYCTANLVRFIRKAKEVGENHQEHQTHMDNHIYYAHSLFYTACLGPLWARLFDINEGAMGIYGREVMVDWLALREDTCFAIFIAMQILLPNLLMRGSMRARKNGKLI